MGRSASGLEGAIFLAGFLQDGEIGVGGFPFIEESLILLDAFASAALVR
jgi:alpha-acetolactate decarboxylase